MVLWPGAFEKDQAMSSMVVLLSAMDEYHPRLRTSAAVVGTVLSSIGFRDLKSTPLKGLALNVGCFPVDGGPRKATVYGLLKTQS